MFKEENKAKLNKLIECCENDVRRWRSCTKPFQIIGKSPFTSALARKCKMLGVAFTDTYTEGNPTIVDWEVVTDFGIRLQDDVDGDDTYTSCCADAVYDILEELGYTEHNVVIVGRGLAVNGLWDRLLEESDNTVTVLHSKSHLRFTQTCAADVLIWAAPKASWSKFKHDYKLIVDLTGDLEARIGKSVFVEDEFVSARDVGRLTTAIAVDRAATWKG